MLTHAGALEGRGPRRGPARVPARRARLPQRHAGRAAARRLRRHGAAQRDDRRPCCKLLWAAPRSSRATPSSPAIAGKAVKEARYHQQHAADWVVRLGDGTDESRRAHATGALDAAVALHRRAVRRPTRSTRPRAPAGLGPRWAELQRRLAAPRWTPMLDEAGAGACPTTRAFRSTGKRGVHSEHMGYILAEMQHLQRAYPGRRVVSATPRRRLARAQAWDVLGTRARPRGAGALGARPGHRARRDRRTATSSRSCSRRPTPAARRPR